MFTGSLPLQVNHRLLAQENRKLQGTILLTEFNRLAETLLESAGEAQVELEFRKVKKGRTLVTGQCTTNVRLTCQACLCSVDIGLRASVHHFIVSSEKDFLALPDDEDGVISAEDMLSLANIFEDELLLDLPMAAKHSEAERRAGKCKLDAGHQNDASPLISETHRPFAKLADLKNAFNRS